MPGQWFSNFRVCQNPLEGLFKHRSLHTTPGVSYSLGLGWGLRVCVFLTNFQVMLLVWRPQFDDHWPRKLFKLQSPAYVPSLGFQTRVFVIFLFFFFFVFYWQLLLHLLFCFLVIFLIPQVRIPLSSVRTELLLLSLFTPSVISSSLVVLNTIFFFYGLMPPSLYF